MLAIRFPVNEIREGDNYFSFEIEGSNLDYNLGDLEFTDPIEVSIYAKRHGLEIRFIIEIDLKLSLVCSRCLKRFNEVQSSEIELIVKLTRGGPHFTDFENEDFAMVESDSGLIDLNERIRTEIILDLPRKPLCSEDCQGLISEDNAEKVDPRWNKLKNISLDD